ncbi:hypothetical protein NLM33_17780 [Bradyrhizobium sp. CCGUVB1N3]|uniref:hypothetical protein n=1 Tax=Bradyrhizobium sp. CCGUVB1N3 TaxID=2949629 RepID=UPI0020B3FDF2|nr:hypothetical protein [Bradyrhizobium sp. CCGUVB1N3]MCP3472167.1 hypothetical protein [Bradyrhizobium sp. CCGUVB1N3]
MQSLRGILGLVASLTCFAVPALAADYPVAPLQERAARVLHIDRGPNPYCGPRCGCPTVVHVRHRSLERSYSYNFDPRTRDEDPHYFYGRTRTYVRFASPANPDRVLQY